jgi:hypothetical protein
MDEIINRYKGKTTSQGHSLETISDGDEVTIGFQHRGEYCDEYDPYVKVAHVQAKSDGYRVGVYHLDAEEPTESMDVASECDLFVAVDKAIEDRSREVGTRENGD